MLSKTRGEMLSLEYKRILTVQDISCVGQCSLTVALPILSACGVETAVLPSAVLSTHTGGFTGYTFRDLTEDMPAIAAHWKKENLSFDAVYTGYLGNAGQIAYVKDIFTSLLTENGKRIVDPAMADNGKLYPGFDGTFVQSMKELAFCADILLPNLTEATLLTDMPYKEQYDEGYIDDLLTALTKNGAKTVLLTGVGYTPDTTGVAVLENGKKQYYRHVRIPQSCHGTGDMFASAFTGAYMGGGDLYTAAQIAADYTVSCIRETVKDPTHWYGVKFEAVLPQLINRLRAS